MPDKPLTQVTEVKQQVKAAAENPFAKKVDMTQPKKNSDDLFTDLKKNAANGKRPNVSIHQAPNIYV